MRSVLIGSEYPVTATPHFLFPEKFILQTHICVQYQKNSFYFVTYSNSYKIAKKWLQNCRSGVVNSKDEGLRPLCERNATMKRRNDPSKIFYIPAWQTGVVERKLAEYARCGYKPMDFQELPCSIWRITFRKSEPHSTDYYLFGRFQAGRGSTLGYDSPCGKEERKISDISRRTLVIGADLLVAELNPDADPHTVAKYRVEKMKAARKLYVSFLLFELLMLPFICLVAFIFVPHDIFFNSFKQPFEFPTDLLPLAIFPVYAAIAAAGCTSELRRLANIK